MRLMGHHDQGDDVIFALPIGRMLDHGGNGNVVLSKHSCDLRQDTRLVKDLKSDIVPASSRGGVGHLNTGFLIGPEFQCFEGEARASDRRIHHVGDNGRCCRHLARAQAVKENTSYGIPDDADGIVGTAALRHGSEHLDESGRDMQFQTARD